MKISQFQPITTSSYYAPDKNDFSSGVQTQSTPLPGGEIDHVVAYLQRQALRDTYSTAEEFSRLKSEWYDAIKFSPGGDERFMHPAYQRIIGLGPSVIPYVIAEIDKTGAPWNWALKALTGDNPVNPENRGRARKIADDWLNWARKKNLTIHD